MKSVYIKIVVIALFILSGICALIYEVAWSKYLALFIGSTAYSHMIVLATYMGGLALGAWYWGKYADKVSNHLKFYGVIEVGIGVYCVAYPLIIETVGNLFIHAASSFDGASNRGVLLTCKFILSFITLILPTFLMGGTLPILTKFFIKRINNSGRDVAVLYYINSFGAVIGTGIAGFFLIRKYGIESTVWVAALVNIVIGLAAIVASKFINNSIQQKIVAHEVEDRGQQKFSKIAIRIALITALVSGFIAMLYELTWIRLLSNILGSTTYSFTLMLIAFISGIALGSLIVSLIIKRIKNLVTFLAICQYGTALSMILMLPLYERLPYYLTKLSARISNEPENFSTFLTLEFLLCFSIMVVPTIFSGMSLPVASRIANSDMQFVGKSIGGIFSINTIGSVAGALFTGLVLIPSIGIKLSLELGVLFNGLLGFMILYKAGFSTRLKMGLAIAFVVFGLGYKILFPAWNQNFLISGAFRTLYTQEVPSYSEFNKQQNDGHKILWHKEGVNANVAVRESQFGDTIQRTLVINGKADASTVGDLQTQVLLGQIPLMLYPNSGDALVIGLGSGITCGSALRHPLKSLDVVEIAAEVVDCNYFFAKENYSFIKDPRVKIYIDDAITHLKTYSKKYDYIISEPSNPWIAGIGNLYSLEYFNLCKAKLKPNGVVAQWFHTYDINNDIFKLVVSTISKAIPHVTVWKISDADVIILASANPLPVDFDGMENKMKHPGIAQDLARIKMYDVPSLLSTQVISARNNPFQYLDTEINTAKKPLLEFLAPVALFTHESVSVLDSLDERFTFQDKNLWFTAYEKQRPLSFENYLNIARYRNAPNIGDVAIAYSALKKGLEMEPGNEEALEMVAKAASNMSLGDLSIRDAQLKELRRLTELYPDDVSVAFEYVKALIDFYRIENSIVNPQQMDDAVLLVKRCININQGEAQQFRFILAMILNGAGRYNEAADAFKDIMKFQKAGANRSSGLSEWQLLYEIGLSLYNSGDLGEAENYFMQIQSIDAKKIDASIMLKKIFRKKSEMRSVKAATI